MRRYISVLFCTAVLAVLPAHAQTLSDADVEAWAASTVDLAYTDPKLASAIRELATLPADFDFPDTLRFSGQAGTDRGLTDSERQTVASVGLLSAFGEACGMAWEDLNFLPFMQWFRSRLPEEDRNGRLVAKVGASHGFAMNVGAQVAEVALPDCERLRPDMEPQFFSKVFDR